MNTTFNYQPDNFSIAKKALEVGVHEELSMFRGWDETRMYGDNLIQWVVEPPENLKSWWVPIQLNCKS